MATIKLEIVSPDKVVYENDISMLIVRSTGGELGILPHHAPLVAGLVPHAMRIRLGADRDEQLIAVAGGFMEVTPEKITVLATAAEQPIDIDINRAKEAMAAPRPASPPSIRARLRARTSISTAPNSHCAARLRVCAHSARNSKNKD